MSSEGEKNTKISNLYLSYTEKLKFHILREKKKLTKEESQEQNDMKTKPLALNQYKQLWNTNHRER